MSVLSFPRRPDDVPASRRSAAPPSPRHLQPVRYERPTTVSATPGRAKLVLSIAIVLVAATAMAYTSMLSGQRQVELQNLQNQYQTDLSNYGALVNSLAGKSTPGIVAQKAAQLHLVQPLWVRQVPAASLATPLPLPTFTAGVTVRPRTSR